MCDCKCKPACRCGDAEYNFHKDGGKTHLVMKGAGILEFLQELGFEEVDGTFLIGREGDTDFVSFQVEK